MTCRRRTHRKTCNRYARFSGGTVPLRWKPAEFVHLFSSKFFQALELKGLKQGDDSRMARPATLPMTRFSQPMLPSLSNGSQCG